MGYTNRIPSLKKIVDDILRRLDALEKSRSSATPVLTDWTYYPKTPQPGAMFIDASTGNLFVYVQDNLLTTNAAVTFTANPVTFTVTSVGSLQANQTIAVDGGTGNKFTAVVQSVTAPNTVVVNFVAVTPATAVSRGFTATVPANPTTFLAGTLLVARSWRQVITSTDLIARQSAIAAGTLSTSSFGGTNSTQGSRTGGTGEIVVYQGYPPYVSK